MEEHQSTQDEQANNENAPDIKKQITESLQNPQSSRKETHKQKPKKSGESSDFADIKKKLMRNISEPTYEKKIPVSGEKYIGTGIEGLDELFTVGIPRGSSVLVVGGPGSGKTIFCLQTLYEAAKAGEKVFYITLEEKPERLKQHMKDFGMDVEPLEKKGHFLIKQFSPIDITRQIDAMLEQTKGELLIDLKPLLFPKGFKPDRIAVDSLSAIAAALFGKEESYRIYIEQLFNLLHEMGSTSFLISETPDPLAKLSVSGAEEFLADGVLIFYNVRHGNIRESAFEVLKMRGSGFKKKIVAMQIQAEKGLVIYPDQEVFTTI